MSHENEQHSTPLIRYARTREIEEMISITLAAYLEYRDAFPAAAFDVYMNELRNLDVALDEAALLVAELDGRAVGTVCFYPNAKFEGLGLPGSWASFRRLAVHPAMRGHGIGGKLVTRCIDMANAQGVPTIGMHTASVLRAACHIYERNGFRRCHNYDLPASRALGIEAGPDDFDIIAYRLDLPR